MSMIEMIQEVMIIEVVRQVDPMTGALLEATLEIIQKRNNESLKGDDEVQACQPASLNQMTMDLN